MKHFCPVCGYDSLTRPPIDYLICPCCGTEFGYDDVAHSWDELRSLWVSKGAAWFSKHTQPPQEWDVLNQIARLTLQNMRNIAGTNDPIVAITKMEDLINEATVLSETDVPIRARATTDNVQAKRADKAAA
jgi:hypothetical protein